MSVYSAPIVLYGFQISHYVEKVRWAMDYCGIEYREVEWTPTTWCGSGAGAPRRHELTRKDERSPTERGAGVLVGSRVLVG